MEISFDMETSGLIGESKPKDEPETRITCIGILDDYGIRQFAAPWQHWNSKPEEAERRILQSFVESRLFRLDSTVITYNGTTFDFPLLKARLEAHGIKDNFDNVPHLDQMPFVTKLNSYRVKKETAASKYADIYTPKTTEAAYFARAYMFKVVSPQIQAKMLAHNAMDVATTWTFHHDMMLFPDYRGFVEETLGKYDSLRIDSQTKSEKVEAFL